MGFWRFFVGRRKVSFKLIVVFLELIRTDTQKKQPFYGLYSVSLISARQQVQPTTAFWSFFQELLRGASIGFLRGAFTGISNEVSNRVSNRGSTERMMYIEKHVKENNRYVCRGGVVFSCVRLDSYGRFTKR